jgi:hypothetical protein
MPLLDFFPFSHTLDLVNGFPLDGWIMVTVMVTATMMEWKMGVWLLAFGCRGCGMRDFRRRRGGKRRIIIIIIIIMLCFA